LQHIVKRISKLSEAVLRRAELQEYLSEILTCFPKIQFEVLEDEIIQKCQWVNRVKLPDDVGTLRDLLSN